MKKIGLYGGSFDPIHFGHINLSLELTEKHSLDQVLFCPAYINPYKQKNSKVASAAHRMKMIELAIEDIPQFKMIDHEVRREGISYTVDTLNNLKKTNEDAKLYLILGLDAAKDFANWKSPEEILNLCTPLIGLRNNVNLELDLTYYSLFEKGLTKTALFDISSSEIRDRVRSKKYIRHLVPSKVVDYIYNNQLYYNI